MSDLVERLRYKANWVESEFDVVSDTLLKEAADALEAKDREIAELHKDYRIQNDEIVRCHDEIERLHELICKSRYEHGSCGVACTACDANIDLDRIAFASLEDKGDG